MALIRVVFAAALLASTALITACGGESAGGRFKRYTVNGVTMIENPARVDAPVTLRLSDSVWRDIGGVQEVADNEFNHRNGFLTGVALKNGGLAVIDWMRVRLFDSSGTQTAVVGREGRGPGEFFGLTWICAMAGDTVLVYDQQRRVSKISPSGVLVNQAAVPDMSTPSGGCFDDGSFVTQAFSRTSSLDVRNVAAERRGADGVVVDTVGILPVYYFTGVSQYVGLKMHGQFVYVSDPRKNEVHRYRMDGALNQVLRMADEARAISAEDAQFILGGPVAAMGSAPDAEPAPKVKDATWPFYKSIRVDRDGRLWIEDFPLDENAPDRWTAYDSTGAAVGTLLLPRGPRRAVPNSPPGAPATMPGSVPEFVDAFGDFVILLERDEDGAAHFRTRKMR
ncbi:MAG: hypothetical protein IT353_17830 [Gemmatimonadaceae bacterium]|nr:hypothetical protein [Gemmatimonadaceae bacterium]